MTLRELGKVLLPFTRIRIVDFLSCATLSVTTWHDILNDTTDLHPCVLDREVMYMEPVFYEKELVVVVREDDDDDDR